MIPEVRWDDGPPERKARIKTLLRLNLGSADRHLEGFQSVDVWPGPGVDIVADLEKDWPWETSSVSEIKAFDILEHLENRIHTFNELHRVLIPGGRAEIVVPSATKGAGFVQDPTHKVPFCLNSFQYFEAGSFAHNRLSKSYGITAAFKVLELSERPYQDVYEQVWKITAILEAVK